MPLFFILSALTFKVSADSGQFLSKTARAFKHLIIPALLAFAFRSTVILIHMNSINWTQFLAKRINILTYASCLSIHVQNAKISGIGYIWFFFALFLARTIFDYLHLKLNNDKKLLIAASACAVIGLIAGKIQPLPFSLDIALVCTPFLYFGYRLKSWRISENSRKIVVASSALWLICVLVSYFWFGVPKAFYLDLAVRKYPLFPLFYIPAITGTLAVSCCCIFLAGRFAEAVKPFLYIGRYSLYLFCVHYADCSFKEIWDIYDTGFYNFLIRLSLDLLLFVILMKLIEFINNRSKQKAAPAQSPQPLPREISNG